MNTVPNNEEQLHEAVRERYGRTALQVLGTGQAPVDRFREEPGINSAGLRAKGTGDRQVEIAAMSLMS